MADEDMFFLSDDDRNDLRGLLSKRGPLIGRGRTLPGAIPSYLVQVGNITAASSTGGISGVTANILSLSSTASSSTANGTVKSSTTGQTVQVYNQLNTLITAGKYGVIREPISGYYIVAAGGTNSAGAVSQVIIQVATPIVGPANGTGVVQVWMGGGLTATAAIPVYNFRANTTVANAYYVGWPISHTPNVFPIISVTAGTSGSFKVNGNASSTPANTVAQVFGSINNNGTFVVSGATFSSSAGTSTISVSGLVHAISPSAAPGYIDVGATQFVLDNQAAFL